MDIGLGIFLGLLFLGTVLLYLKTRDRWNWRRIARRIALAGVGIVVLAIVTVAGYLAYEKWRDRPQLVTSLEGVSVGEKLTDVVFKQGTFKKVEDANADGSERHSSAERRLTVWVRAGVVESVVYICDETGDYRRVSAISCGSSGDEIQNRFAGQVRVQCAIKKQVDDEFRRVYDIPGIGVRYLLWQNKVAGFFVTSPQYLETLTGKSWGPCT